MRAFWLALIFVCGSAPAFASNFYLPEPSLAAATARSVQEAKDMGASGDPTPPYWNVIVCPNGAAYVEIESIIRPGLPGADFTANPRPVSVVDSQVVYGNPTGLSLAEQSTLLVGTTLVSLGCPAAY